MQYKSKKTDEIIEAEQFHVGFVSDKLRSYIIPNAGDKLGINLKGVCDKCSNPLWHHMYVKIPLPKEESVSKILCEGDYLCFIDGGYPWVIPEKTFNEQYEPYTPKDGNVNFDEAIKEYLPKNTHPLKNPDSSHYAMWHNGDGEAVEAIDLMEKMFAPEELLAWAKITALKYRLRIGKKDDIAKEMKKIETYEAYIAYLEGKPR